METSAYYSLQDKQLCFRLKENIVADPDIYMRFRGRLNTVTGGFEYQGSVKKMLSSGPVLKGEGTQPLRFGAGVGVSNQSSDEPYLTASLKKQIALFDGPHTILTGKAHADYEPRNGKFSKFAAVRVSRRFLNFTEHQDLQLSVGLDLDMPGVSKRASGASSGVSQKLKPDLYLSARENNWGIHYRRGRWQLTYDL